MAQSLFISGYIPRRSFKFGASYKVSCDDCIDQFMTMRDTTDLKHNNLVKSARAYPRLEPIDTPDNIRDKLNSYTDAKLEPTEGSVNRE